MESVSFSVILVGLIYNSSTFVKVDIEFITPCVLYL